MEGVETLLEFLKHVAARHAREHMFCLAAEVPLSFAARKGPLEGNARRNGLASGSNRLAERSFRRAVHLGNDHNEKSQHG
ncbi:hypothetical protein [Ancylobacter sp. G4_0304]|uniref:hypothetical protein n=1 Tax=Ancylobacter sp. G4_0304 TaxID=3114289 RepID=UPI0039C5B3D5